MKRNLIFVSCLALLLSACSLAPSQSPEVTTVEALTGGMTLIPTHNQDGIPYCKDYLLKPLQTGNIIKINDVVEKCKVQKGHVVYTPYGGGGNIPEILSIHANGSSQSGGFDGAIPFCAYGEAINYFPKSNYSAAVAFIEKYFFHEMQPFSTMYAEGLETSESVRFAYRCKEKSLCKKLIDTPFGENDKHYFYRTGEMEGEYLKVDETIYSLGKRDRYDSSDQIVQESLRKVGELKGDKLIVHRYIDGQLLEPYKSNPALIDTDENYEKARWTTITIGTFGLQTCEVPLAKTP